MNTASFWLSVLSLAGGFTSAQAVEAMCNYENGAVVASTPSVDFTVHPDGTVTHNSTGLMWMRCSLGQQWDGMTCSGQYQHVFSWTTALAAAEGEVFAGYSDWRLPNKHELASIVEQRCLYPSINSQIFPQTHNSWYWTSSPVVVNGVVRGWPVWFTTGMVIQSWDEGESGAGIGGVIRLVRTAP